MKKRSSNIFITYSNYLSRLLKVLKNFWVSLVSLFYAFTLSIHVTLPVYLQWSFAFAILFIFPGLVLNRFLRSIFRFKVKDAPSMGVVAALSVITFSITLLILNYSPLTFCTVTFVQLLSIVIVGLDFISFSLSKRLPKPQNSLNNDQNHFDSALSSGEITERKKLAMFTRNLLIIAIVTAFYLSQEFIIIIFSLPMRLSTILGTSVISLLFVLVIGIPITSMFWYFIADPSLNSCKRLNLHVFRKSNHLTLKSKLISPVAVALVAALIAAIPMVLQFLPPGFDTGKYLLELDGLFMNHFNFPFALEGRMRAVRPITYLNLAAIRLAFGVDALMAQRIYVVIWYAIVTVGMYGLIVRYKDNSVAVTTAILWAMALPSLSLIMGINAQLAGSIFIFPIIELLFQATKSKVAYILFVLLGIFLILADDLLFIFYFEFIIALSAIFILNSILNGTFRQRIKENLSFFVLGITPFIVMTPYLFKYLQVYTSRILSLELQTAATQNASEYLLKTFNMLISPWGWFGPVICLILVLGAYHLVRGKHRGVGPLTFIAIIWMMLALVHWFSPVLYPVASSTPIRFLELATFPTSFLLAKLLLDRSSPAGLKRAKSLIVKPSFCNFKIRIIGHSRFIRFIAVGFIMVPITCSSLQYALGEYPNIFSTYQHPAAISYPERESYFEAILWMRDNLPNGVVLTDFSTGNWYPALLGNFTVGILDRVAYGYGAVVLWHKQPYWDTKFVMESFDGYLSISYLRELREKLRMFGLGDDPIYLLITPFFNSNFPQMRWEDFDKLSFLQKIYESNASDIKNWVAVYSVSSDIFLS